MSELGKQHALELGLRIPEHLAQRGIRTQQREVGKKERGGDGRLVEGPAEQVLSLGEGPFRPPYPGHVLPDDEGGRDPTAVPERRG